MSFVEFYVIAIVVISMTLGINAFNPNPNNSINIKKTNPSYTVTDFKEGSDSISLTIEFKKNK